MFRSRRLGHSIGLIVASCSMGLAFGDAGAEELGASGVRSDRIVVLISVDGLASYYLDDPQAAIPTIRRLAKEGAFAERMQCSLPTVTWPNHTTLVTGVHPARHGVIGNSVWDREAGKSIPYIPDPLFDKDEIVKSPTIYDAAHDAGLKTAGVIWPASRGAKSLDWTVPDVFSNELFLKYGTPGWLDELRAAGIPVDKQEEWCRTGKGVERDIMYAQMTAHVIENHKPNLVLLHLVEVDHVQHAKGPRAPESYEAVAFADERVKVVVDAVERSFPKRGTVIVASDHGFIPYQQQILPNVALRQAGLLRLSDDGQVASRDVTSLGQGGSAFIYIVDPSRRKELRGRVAELLAGIEGVADVLGPDRFAEFGLADPEKNPVAPDLVLTANSGFTFSDTATGDEVVTAATAAVKGSHGHDPRHPLMGGSFIAWGAGIKPGTKLEEIRNLDVAPTIARLLNVDWKETDGKPLDAIIE